MSIVVPHETLDRKIGVIGLQANLRQGLIGRTADTVGILPMRLGHRTVSESLGHLLLKLESHLIVCSIRSKMELVSSFPEELEGLPILLHFHLGQEPEMKQVVDVTEGGLGAARNPIGRMIVA